MNKMSDLTHKEKVALTNRNAGAKEAVEGLEEKGYVEIVDTKGLYHYFKLTEKGEKRLKQTSSTNLN